MSPIPNTLLIIGIKEYNKTSKNNTHIQNTTLMRGLSKKKEKAAPMHPLRALFASAVKFLRAMRGLQDDGIETYFY
jgi:hypothetical protein